MPVRKISTEIALSGEKEFNSAMKDINSNLKTLKSDMKLASSEFDTNANSVEALQTKQKLLKDAFEQSQEKVNALRDHLSEVISVYGENSLQADNYRQKLNDATIQQNNFARELADTTTALEKATDPLSGVKSALSDLLDQKVEKLIDPLAGVKDKLQNMTAEDIKNGLDSLKGKIGEAWDVIKTAPLDILQGAAGALVDMGKAVFDQTMGAADYADDILTLSTNTGLSTESLQEFKYMAGLTDTSLETITGSMTKLTKNMDKARDGSGTAASAFETLGIAVTNEDGTLRSNQEVFGEIIDALGQMEEGTERDALSMEIFGRSAQDLNSLIATGSEGINGFAQEAQNAGAVLDEETLISLRNVRDSMDRFKGTFEATKTALGAEFAEPVEQILTGLTEIMQGNIDAGMESIIAGIDSATEIIDGMFPIVEDFLVELLNKFIEKAPDLLAAGVDLIVELVNGIATTLPEIIPQMIQAIVTMVQTLTSPDNLASLVGAGMDLMIQLALGLVQAIPELIPALVEAVATIISTIWDKRGDLVEAGKDLIRGLVDGIVSMGSYLWEKISGIFSGIVSSVKNFFGIASPSKLFKNEIGRNLALGLGEGFGEEMKNVNRDMLDSVNTDFSLTPNVALQRGISGGQNYGAAEVRADMQQITAGMVNGLQTAFSGAQSAPSSINVNLTLPDGTSILRYFIDLSRANGTPIASPA